MALAAAACALAPQLVAQTQPVQKVDIVTVTGCLTQGPGDTWMLSNATDPVVVNRIPATGASSEPPATTTTPATAGKNRFRLIGTLELGVPAHKGHTVTIKGLLIPAQPDKRINLTSVQMVAATCTPGPAAKQPRSPRTE